MDFGFKVIQKDIKQTYDIVEKDIAHTYNSLHNEILQTDDKMNKGFNMMQAQIDNTNKNMGVLFTDIKGEIKDVKNEMNINIFSVQSDIKNLNEKMNVQNSKINDELKNQNAKIIQNEVMVNNHEKILNNLYQSNEKQRDLITKHEIIINRQQDSIMNCIENVKDLYKEANEIKQNLLKENSKLNEFCQKNNVEIEGLKRICQDEINKVNSISEVLNKHTEILTENSAMYAKIQALTYQNCDKIDEICKQLFNHETRIKDIEGRLDKVEAILAEHEKALNDIVGDVADMKI